MPRDRDDRYYDRYDRDRYDRDRYEPDDRGLGERLGDEMRSWLGDEDAERRRRADRMERERYGAGYGRGDPFDRGGAGYGGGDPGRGGDPYRDRGGLDDAGAGRYGAGPLGGGYREGEHGSGYARRYGRGRGYDSAGRAERYGYDRADAANWNERTARGAGPHAGRGPEGYQRSADRILEDAHEALTWHGHVDASGIEVTVDGDEITLEGAVDSRRAKRAAEDAVEDIRGVHDVHNRLRIRRASEEEGAAG